MKIQTKLVSMMSMMAILAVPYVSYSAQGNVENGKKIYDKKCIWCHGEKGAGEGPAAERINPAPRDFTSGMYKIKTSPFDEVSPTDEDIFRMISDGMPDSSMPLWKDILTEQERWDLVAYLKSFAGLEKPAKVLDFSKQVKTSKESIERGKKLFLDRCAECHGDTGKGVATKKLKDDLGFRTWPRDFSKAWTFRGSNDPKDIFARVSVGIPGTQMPSFADPGSKKKMTDEERWDVSNYVASLADETTTVKAENTVVKASRIQGDLPSDPNDPKWKEAEPSSFLLVPQIIGQERFFTPSNNSVTSRAYYNDKEISILLEWNDRTQSIPGDAKSAETADGEVSPDAVAIQFPVTIPQEMEKPYFGHGDTALPVNIWYWNNGASGGAPVTKLLNGTGFKKSDDRDAAKAGLMAKGVYDNGTWRVVMKRPLATGEKDKDIQFVEGKFTPIAFAAWDGSNNEKGSKHTMTTWYWILLKPKAGIDVYVIPVIVLILVVGAELLWLRSASKKKNS